MTTTLDLPFWFKQRQARTEDLGSGRWKVTGPNLAEAVIGVRMTDNLNWQAFVSDSATGPDVEATDASLPTARDAIAAAFEMYRERFVN